MKKIAVNNSALQRSETHEDTHNWLSTNTTARIYTLRYNLQSMKKSFVLQNPFGYLIYHVDHDHKIRHVRTKNNLRQTDKIEFHE